MLNVGVMRSTSGHREISCEHLAHLVAHMLLQQNPLDFMGLSVYRRRSKSFLGCQYIDVRDLDVSFKLVKLVAGFVQLFIVV